MFRSQKGLLHIIFYMVLYLIFSCAAAPAAETSSMEDVTNIQNLYQNIYKLSFDFSQQTTTGSRVRTGEGHGIFLRSATPSPQDTTADQIIMRWNYTHPAKQIIVNTGEQLSIYTEADKQLLITPVDQSTSDITMSLFSGTGDIIENFTLSEPETDQQLSNSVTPWKTMLLTPREPHAQLQQLRIWYSADFLIHKLVLLDHFDSVTTIVLTNIDIDTTSPPSEKQLSQVTHIDIPEDTEIIRQ